LSKHKRVIIADDEQLICVLLEKIILWKELDMELIGAASDGIELWEMIRSEQPDIVITDINMPNLDGIELIRRVREKGIPCHFIIVSGYRLFEYAQNALKYNVEDYILKPINNEELNNCLRELSKKIDMQNSHNEHVSMNNEEYKNYLMKRVTEALGKNEMTLAEVNERFNLQLSEGCFQVVRIALDIKDRDSVFSENNAILKKLSVEFERIMSRACGAVLVAVDSFYIHALINYAPSTEKKMQECIQEYFNCARDLVSLFVGVRITIGIGNAMDAPHGIAESENQARCALFSRIREGCNRVIEYRNINVAHKAFSQEKHEELLRALKHAFEGWDEEAFEKIHRQIFRSIRMQFCPTEVLKLCNEIVDCFLNSCRSIIAEYSNEEYIRNQIEYAMRCASDINELENAILEPVSSLMKSLIQNFKNKESQPILHAMNYIMEHYNEDVCLEVLAEEVKLSPNYFSSLFKKETNMNFSDYLTDVRMQKAKELLQQSNYNISEIAFKVGYSDGRYFSKLFLKTVGLKPAEYRKIYG